MKKILLLIFICSLNFTTQAQQFLSINPNFANSGQTLSTTVTSTGFYYTMGSAPGQFWQDFYMYQGSYIIFPNSINVLDDDHLDVNWSIPAAAPSGNYEVVWEYFRSRIFTMDVPGGFNINCVPVQAVIAQPIYYYICPSGGSATLTANSGTGLTYQWFKNNVQSFKEQRYKVTMQLLLVLIR
jgi:hypothetical protein